MDGIRLSKLALEPLLYLAVAVMAIVSRLLYII